MITAPTGLAALVAALPLLVLFALLASGKVKGWIAALAGLLAALAVAILAWRLPVAPALAAAARGAGYALFPILWILVAALWIYRLSVDSGQFEIVKQTLADLTPDRRLQVLIVAFAFGAFLEGTAGYGVPVAITSAMLIGLGFPPATAALLCLVANSSPVAFAAAGVPVTVAADVAGLDVMAVSRYVGLLLPPLSLLVPAWLCVMLCGWRASIEVLPAILVGGITLAGTQFLAARFLGPWTTGVLSGLATIAALGIFVRFWKPRRAWDFAGGRAGRAAVLAAAPVVPRARGSPCGRGRPGCSPRRSCCSGGPGCRSFSGRRRSSPPREPRSSWPGASRRSSCRASVRAGRSRASAAPPGRCAGPSSPSAWCWPWRT